MELFSVVEQNEIADDIKIQMTVWGKLFNTLDEAMKAIEDVCEAYHNDESNWYVERVGWYEDNDDAFHGTFENVSFTITKHIVD